jgi:hypothetical protein
LSLDIQPPLWSPLVYESNLHSPSLQQVQGSLPWCELLSLHFLFFLEGVAAFRARARLLRPGPDCRAEFDRWENEDLPGGAPRAYQLFQPLAEQIGKAFMGLAAGAGLTPIFERPERFKVRWIYPVFFSDAEWVYTGNDGAGKPAVAGGAEVVLGWRGAHVRTPADQGRVEDIFLAASLAWQSLYTLNKFLATALQQLVLRQEADDAVTFDTIRTIRESRFFSNHLLDASRPLRWTIKGDGLGLFKVIEAAWETAVLRGAIPDQAGMADLAALYYEQIEARRTKAREDTRAARERAEQQRAEAEKRAQEDRAKREQRTSDTNKLLLTLFGLVLSALSIVNVATNLINLYDPAQHVFGAGWGRVYRALGVAAALVLVLLVLFGLIWWRGRRAED